MREEVGLLVDMLRLIHRVRCLTRCLVQTSNQRHAQLPVGICIYFHVVRRNGSRWHDEFCHV